MKNIVEYINESIFGDNIKSAVKINGITIYEPDWKHCEEFFQKRRKKYFDNKSTVTLGDMGEEYNIVYNQDDCVVAIGNRNSINDVYVLCPETIYMNHEIQQILNDPYPINLYNINSANDFDINFSWFNGRWSTIYYSYLKNREKILKDAGFDNINGYIPSTISKKAQDIIKKYTK